MDNIMWVALSMFITGETRLLGIEINAWKLFSLILRGRARARVPRGNLTVGLLI